MLRSTIGAWFSVRLAQLLFARCEAEDAVWEPLDALDPLAKQVMVEAVTAAVSHDGRVVVAEAELLRTICAALHCPLPPMLERA